MSEHPMVTREQVADLIKTTLLEDTPGPLSADVELLADRIMALHFPRIEVLGEGVATGLSDAAGSYVGVFLPCPAGTRVQVVAIDE